MIKKILVSIMVILVLAGAIFLIKGSASKTGNAIKENTIKEFTIEAFKYGYSPDSIIINKGDKVRIKIDNTDVPHGIRIPEYNVKDENSIEFTADKAGEFPWYCAVYCGEGHMKMKGKLIVK